MEREDGEVGLVVVHDEQALSLEIGVGRFLAPGPGGGRADGEEEGRPAADFTRDGDGTAHELHQPLADRQTQAGAPLGPGHGRVDLAEDFEKEVHLLMRNAHAGIAHGEAYFPHVVHFRRGLLHLRQGAAGDLEADFAPVGELDRVADEIEENLAQALVITDETRGQILMDDVDEIEALLARFRRHQVERFLDAGTEIERKLVERQLARLDLREIEDVVDNGQERFAAGAQRLDEFMLGRREVRLQEQAGHADNAVHGRADFVAHVGEKFRLGAISCLGHFLGLEQLVLVIAPFGDVAGGERVEGHSVHLGAVKRDLRGETAALAGNRLGLDIGDRGLPGLVGLLARLGEKSGLGKKVRRSR